MPHSKFGGYVRTTIACDACNKKAFFVVRALVKLDSTACKFCGSDIDLRPMRPKLESLAEPYRELDKIMSPNE